MKLWVMSALAIVTLLSSGCSKPTPEELFARAQQAQRQAEAAADTTRNPERLRTLFAPALEAYGKLIDEYPKSEFVEPSLFMTGTILNNNTREYPLAVEAYRRYLAMFPNGKQAELASFLIGYLYNNELHNLDSAAAAYRRYLERYPNSEMAASARFELNTLGKSPDDLLPKEDSTGTQVAAAKAKKHSQRK